ncbi:MAG TPA: ABC transporter ATP-binding protein [Pseudomonas xinjiangensis]|uniref:ABC transporter ATP-binding protein n=2 Tax=root TaxID=1 RepID=A0A7V1BPN7_9GAMM|nr:ABC transporter ATP-binding protein [Halopseudomonas xinjiangensis]HEC49352.1 ABC transporter ATP-binding protein [Halopseudomonas xinjiangensis]
MFSESEYQTVWMIYLAASVCGWLVWWQMTRWIKWWWLREPLWVVMAVLLFTPAYVEPMQPWLAPAFIVWLLDTLFSTGDNAARMLGDLALAMVVALVTYVGFACLRAAWKHWRGRNASAPAAN